MRNVRNILAVVAAISAVTMLTVPTLAEVIPPYLPPGSQYQLIFVTSGTTTATSTNIADYNTFVSQQAAPLNSLLPAGVTWSAIAFTQTTNAKDNASTSPNIPIYNTHGVLIAYGSIELWSWNIESPVALDQYGDIIYSTGLKQANPSWLYRFT